MIKEIKTLSKGIDQIIQVILNMSEDSIYFGEVFGRMFIMR